MPKTLLGTLDVFMDWPNGPMWTGSGVRNASKNVSFPPGYFTAKPQVIAPISGLDCSHEFNTRVRVTVQNVTKNGFTVNVETWAETKLAMVAVAWTAHQP